MRYSSVLAIVVRGPCLISPTTSEPEIAEFYIEPAKGATLQFHAASTPPQHRPTLGSHVRPLPSSATLAMAFERNDSRIC